MKKLILIIMSFVVFAACTKKAVEQKNEPVKEPEKKNKTADELEIISYRLGFNAAVVTLKDFPTADAESMAQGVKDAFKNSINPKYNDTVFNQALAKYKKNKISIDAKKRLPQFIRNEPVSKKYIKEQAARKGVKELKKGVLLEVLKKGQGEKITTKDLVKVHYRGWDARGKLFDSSYKRKRPSIFNLHKLIEGLRIAFLEMKKGGKYNVFIPQKLGYGSTGHKERVEAGMALKFEVTVLDIKKNAAKKPVN